MARAMASASITCLMLLFLPFMGLAEDRRDWQAMRDQLVKEIREDTYRVRDYLGKSELSAEVLGAIAKVERHRFVPESQRKRAYGNYPLPIGDDQTISQPFIVALMTDLLEIDAESRVLELGTGSGYQAAVLAELVSEVYTVEIVANLASRAMTTLGLLGYRNIKVRHGDGTKGWPEAAPFDGVIVTAAGIEIPQSLIDQLRPGGRLVMPVGGQFETQQLRVLIKAADGALRQTNVLPVRFVPITDEIR
jgi:protein-L-isoaspartate(D-aspartate) O-methyltransferase